MAINSFRGQYAFLSNMYPCRFKVGGIVYNSAENAFQAMKTLDNNERMKIAQMDPYAARKYGRHLQLRSDWNQIRLTAMNFIVHQKFVQNPVMMQMLQETAPHDLMEGNTWGDRFWGVDAETGIGQNNLGRILMQVRSGS